MGLSNSEISGDGLFPREYLHRSKLPRYVEEELLRQCGMYAAALSKFKTRNKVIDAFNRARAELLWRICEPVSDKPKSLVERRRSR